MDEKKIQVIKNKLIKERDEIEEQLSKIANKANGEWKIRFPDASIEGSHQEPTEAADEIEEYTLNIPLKQTLEKKLSDINEALSRIDNKNYDICYKCGGDIEEERLLANSTTKLCSKCIQN